MKISVILSNYNGSYYLEEAIKSVLEQEVVDLVKRTDLEEETIKEVVRILKEEFEE